MLPKQPGKVIGEELVLFFDKNLDTLESSFPVQRKQPRSARPKEGQD